MKLEDIKSPSSLEIGLLIKEIDELKAKNAELSEKLINLYHNLSYSKDRFVSWCNDPPELHMTTIPRTDMTVATSVNLEYANDLKALGGPGLSVRVLSRNPKNYNFNYNISQYIRNEDIISSNYRMIVFRSIFEKCEMMLYDYYQEYPERS